MLARSRLVLAFRLALRELRGGLKGFYIFLACIALGTGAIAAVNSVSRSITDAISTQGQSLLAADVRFALNNREATPEELGYLNSLGTLSRSTDLRSMARKKDGTDQALVEVKAVDSAYPLYGRLEAEPDQPLSTLLASEDGTFGAVVAPLLLERLNIAIGTELLLGNAKLRVTGTLKTEPDSVSEGFAFAPRLLTSEAALAASGLIQTGSLVEHSYKIRADDPGKINEVAARANAAFPQAGWSIRTSDKAAPALADNIKRFSQFLTLVGLTALIVGGVGVTNAVRGFLDAKRTTIATFKCLGAPAFVVVAIYLMQILMISLSGILIGLVLGAAAPLLSAQFMAKFLPISTAPRLYPEALSLAALFGLLTTAGFAILPLGHAREVPATALFREQGFEVRRLPSWPYLLVTAFLVAALAVLAIMTAYDRFIALVFVVSIAAAFGVLLSVAAGVSFLARRSPRVRSPALRLAIANIHRPGALTSSVVLSLGLGLTLLVTIMLIDGNMRRELTGRMAERAPNFFFVDIQGSQLDGFRKAVRSQSPDGQISEVPMLRGRIIAFNGEDVTKRTVPPEGQWVLRGDRGITYADALPENASLTDGGWWTKDYSGAPLVSFSAEEGKALGLKLGDTVTVNVLGRNITATIANFRKVDWQSLSINFVMIFSSNTFKGAPHAWLATLTAPSATPAGEAAVLKAVTNAYPTITSIRVKDALDILNTLVRQLAGAIRAAAAVALAASVLVLAGALAAGNRARTHDAVVLKTLGATRPLLMRAFIYEYLILGAATAAFALFAGTMAAWYVVSHIMHLPSAFLPQAAFVTLVTALVLTVSIGLAGTWRVLGQKSAPVLREL
jgi:putative ABC transport system permease protein